MPEDVNDDRKSASDHSSDDNHISSWSLNICYYGTEQKSFFKTQRLHRPTYSRHATWSPSCLVSLIEWIGF